MFASKNNRDDLVQELLDYDFNTNQENSKWRNAIDYAWSNYNYSDDENFRKICNSIILRLLNANSRFPSRLVNFNYEKAEKNVQNFIDLCEELHQNVEYDDIINLEINMNKMPHLYYFYDRNNESLLFFALKRSKLDIFEVFNKKLSIQLKEKIDKLHYKIPEKDKKSEIYPEAHILTLKAKSHLKTSSNDQNNQEKWNKIEMMFTTLNKIKLYSKILQIAAEISNLKIIFDFTHSIAYYKGEANNKLRSNSAIIIGLKQLMSKEDEIQMELNEVLISKLSQFIHEMTNINLAEYLTCDDKHFEDLIRVIRVLQNEKMTISFNELPEPMKMKVRQTDVIFQGTHTSIESIINNQFEILSSEIIKDILIHLRTIKIGAELKSNLMHDIIDRKFVEFESNNPFDLISTIKSVTEGKSGLKQKIFILADAIGTGKSSSFINTAIQLKENYKGHWILHIQPNILEYVRKFKKSKKNTENIDQKRILELLINITSLNSKLEKIIFKILFNRNKIIFLIDGFNEFDKDVADFVTNVISFINKQTENIILISTDEACLSEFEEKINALKFKFQEITNNEKEEIIFNILKANHLNCTQLPDKLVKFIQKIEHDNVHNITNLTMIEAIAKVYAAQHTDVIQSTEFNSFKYFEEIFEFMRSKFIKNVKLNVFDPMRRLSISQIYIIHALKFIFPDNNDELKKFDIIKIWEKEKERWPSKLYNQFGFLTIDDNRNDKFLHISFAEYFIAKFIISTLFVADYTINQEDLKRTFQLLMSLTDCNNKNFNLIRSFIFDYTIANINNQNHQLCEGMKIVANDKLKWIPENVSLMTNELIEFYAYILINDCKIFVNFCLQFKIDWFDLINLNSKLSIITLIQLFGKLLDRYILYMEKSKKIKKKDLNF